MFLSELQAALNDVLVSTQTLAHHYQHFAGEDIEGREVLAELAERKRQHVPELQDVIRSSGSLPAVPDPEREGSEQVLTHVMRVLSGDPTGTLVERLLSAEEELRDAISRALEEACDAPVAAVLEDIRRNSVVSSERLAGL